MAEQCVHVIRRSVYYSFSGQWLDRERRCCNKAAYDDGRCGQHRSPLAKRLVRRSNENSALVRRRQMRAEYGDPVLAVELLGLTVRELHALGMVSADLAKLADSSGA